MSTKRRRAQRRWHPDTIAFTRPDEDTTSRYKNNFQKIDEAVSTLEAYLSGDFHVGNQTLDENFDRPTEEPEEVIRRNAPEMQENLRRYWSQVKENKYKMEEKEIRVNDGVPYRDLLMDDLREDLPVLSIASFFNGIFIYIILGLIFYIFFSGSSASIALTITGIWWALHSLAKAYSRASGGSKSGDKGNKPI